MHLVKTFLSTTKVVGTKKIEGPLPPNAPVAKG